MNYLKSLIIFLSILMISGLQEPPSKRKNGEKDIADKKQMDKVVKNIDSINVDLKKSIDAYNYIINKLDSINGKD